MICLLDLKNKQDLLYLLKILSNHLLKMYKLILQIHSILDSINPLIYQLLDSISNKHWLSINLDLNYTKLIKSPKPVIKKV